MAHLEVPGRSPPAAGSDYPYCQICIKGGNAVEAYAFCTVCTEFMCSGCSNVHRRSKATRNHHQLDKEHMPSKDTVKEVHENLSEHCEKHPRELIKYFCPVHQDLLCGDCIAFDSHTCKLESILNISVSFQDSSVYKDIQSFISKLADDAGKTTTAVENKAMAIDDSERKDTTEVNEFQSNVMACLNRKVQNLHSQIAIANQELKIKLIHLQERSKETKVEAIRLKVDMEENVNNNVLLFISAHRTKNRANHILDKLCRLEEEVSNIPTYEFTPSSQFEAALKGSNCIGIYRSSADTHAHRSDEICSDEHKGSFTKIDLFDIKTKITVLFQNVNVKFAV